MWRPKSGFDYLQKIATCRILLGLSHSRYKFNPFRSQCGFTIGLSCLFRSHSLEAALEIIIYLLGLFVLM